MRQKPVRATSVILLMAIVLSTVSCSKPVEEAAPELDKEAEKSIVSVSVNENATVLTLACWVADIQISILVSEFNQTNADYQIKLVEYYEADAQDVDAALARMNTKLITGDIPDLFFFDSMDVKAISNAGLLRDLYPLMESDGEFQSDDYFMNVWDMFGVDGALYEFVPCFQINCLEANDTVVSSDLGLTYDDFLRIAESDAGSVVYTSQKTMLSYMIQYSLDGFIDLDKNMCDFESESFKKWLEVVKSVPESRNESATAFTPRRLTGVEDYMLAKANRGGEAPVYLGYPSENGSGPCASALWSFGISTSTKYPEVCWSFLKTMLTKEKQENLFCGTGFPMLLDAHNARLAAAALPEDDPDFAMYQCDDDAGKQVPPITETDVAEINNLIDSVTHVRLRYQAVKDIIEEECQYYLSGERTASQTADYIQNRVSTYLAEQG